MRTLVLCIDRDNDIGAKAGIPGPIIGRRDNLDAVTKLGLVDGEDADVNTMLVAIGKYDDLVRNGIEAEVATISGDVKVGDRSDREIVRQLEEVLDEFRPDTAYLISDGAEDEYVFPLISSRVKVDHVRRVFVKQQQSIESFVSLVAKTFRDEKWRKRLLTLPGLILFLLGLFALIPIIITVWQQGWPSLASGTFAYALISLLLGLYILFMAYPITFSIRRGVRRVRDAYDDARSSVMSGDVTIFFNIVAWILIILGIFWGVDATLKAVEFVEGFFFFVGGFIWLFIAGIYVHELGRIIVVVFKKRKFPRSFWPITIFFLVVVIIMWGVLDTLSVLFGYKSPADMIPTLVFIFGLALTVLILGTTGWRLIERKAPAEAEWRR
jgi:putative membrane protein